VRLLRVKRKGRGHWSRRQGAIGSEKTAAIVNRVRAGLQLDINFLARHLIIHRTLSRFKNSQNVEMTTLSSSVAGGSFLYQEADPSPPGLCWSHELTNGVKDHLDLFVVRADLPLQLC